MRRLLHGAAARGSPDVRIAALAGAQHGVVTRAQLLALGIGRGAIGHRVASQRLHRVHRGVYLVGHPVPASHALEMAAVLAHGADAVLSHRSAAVLWAIARPDPGAPVDVTVPGRRPGEHPGIRAHRARRLAVGDVRALHGIRVTAPARTLLGLAALASRRELERSLDEAMVRRIVRISQIRAAIGRAPTSRGVATLRALIDRDRPLGITRSEAEERLLAMIRSARLPTPRVNPRVAGLEVDLLWPAQRLVVEMDGYTFHSSRAAFERDRARDAALQARGYRVLRVTWRQVVDEREAVAATLGAALARGDPPTRG